MALPAQSGLPDSIQAGDTLRFTESLAGYPATTYRLDVVLSLAGTNVAVIRATADGTEFEVAASAAITAQWLPGRYDWAKRLTEIASGEVVTVSRGQVDVLPDVAATQEPTWAQQSLEAVEATIKRLSSGVNLSASFNGQTFTKRDIGQLMEMRDKLRSEVAASFGNKSVKTIQTRFK